MPHESAPPGRRDGSGWSQEGSRSSEQLSIANKLWGHRRGTSEPLEYSPLQRESEQLGTHSPGEALPQFEQVPRSLKDNDLLLFRHTVEAPLKPPSQDNSVISGVTQVNVVQHSTSNSVPKSHVSLPVGSPTMEHSITPASTVAAVEKGNASNPPTVVLGQTSEVRMDINPVIPVDTDAAKIHPAFASEWRQIEKCRKDNMYLQLQIHDFRRQLREKQHRKAILEDQLFQRMRKKEMGVMEDGEKEEEPILDLMQRYQDARDDYGPVEDDCNQKESELYIEESKVRGLEKDFFERLKFFQPSLTEQPTSPEIEQSTGIMEDSEDEDENFNYHPLVAKYHSKLGDLDILQERIEEIWEEREQLEDQRDVRGRVGMSLGKDEQNWLEDSHRREKEAEEQLRVLEVEVETLKQECLSKKLIDEYGDPTDFSAHEQEFFEKEDDLGSGPQISEYSKYPILLPHQRGLKKDDGSVSFLPPKTFPDDKPDSADGRINSWMLGRLRTSPLEIELLARTYEDHTNNSVDSDLWQKLVVDLWYEDGTAVLRPGFNVSRSMRTQAAAFHGSDQSTTSSDVLGSKVAPSPQFLFFRSSPQSQSHQSDATEIANPPG